MNILNRFKANPSISAKWTAISDDLADLLVEDVIGNNLKNLFILESPHTHEFEPDNLCPAAGDAGVYMTTVIIESGDLPFGKLLKERNNTLYSTHRLNSYGIMNVCQIPLQGAAYRNTHHFETYNSLFAKFKTLRGKAAQTRRDAITGLLEMEIKEDFFQRLHRCLGRFPDTRIISCGRFAQSYCALFEPKRELKRNIVKVPHPSMRQWLKPEVRQYINKAVREL